MEQEDKELLLKDLSARLPYTVFIDPVDCGKAVLIGIKDGGLLLFDTIRNEEYDRTWDIEYCKPYLRPMSSMTEEENAIFDNMSNKDRGFEEDEDGWIRCDSIHTKWGVCPDGCAKLLDYLNSIHIDYRGLIEKGLAIEVTEENNPYKD